MHGQQPLVVSSAALLMPLLRQQRREGSDWAGGGSDALVPGAGVHAAVATAAGGGTGSDEQIPLRLLGLAEMPGVRRALLDLLAAPSISPGGWQLGWLPHRRPSSGCGGGDPPTSDGLAMLQAACHAAVLAPASAEGAAALRRVALPWPSGGGGSAPQPGARLVVAGAPFGALSPRHFSGFLSTGVLSGTVPADPAPAGSGVGGSGTTVPPALLLTDARCGPGMEGGPVLEDLQGEQQAAAGQDHPACQRAAGERAAQRARLLGMLLPPIKGPAAQVEFSAAAPAPAVLAAVQRVAGGGASAGPGAAGPITAAADGGWRYAGQAAVGGCNDRTAPAPARLHGAEGGASSGSAGGGAALAAAARGVVAIAAGPTWASGVLVSSGGHILTNAHLLPTQGAAAAAPPPAGAPGASDRLQAAAAAAPAAPQPLRVLLPAGGGGAGPGAWAAADVLYVFGGPLDLAVLQLQPPWRPTPGGAAIQGGGAGAAAWAPLRLAEREAAAGGAVAVLGFPAVNPRASPLSGPLATGGNLAKVLCSPRRHSIWAVARPLVACLGQPAKKIVGDCVLRADQPAWQRAGQCCRREGGAPREREPCLACWLGLQPQTGCRPPPPSHTLTKPARPTLLMPVPIPIVVCLHDVPPQVVRLGGGGEAAMLLTTAAVHSGASGGAVLDPASGQLLGLVTSNAKHTPSRASADAAGTPTVLPHINFCIAAAQLRPVVAAAHAAAAAGDGDGRAAAVAAWQAIDAWAAADEEMRAVWQLGRSGEGQQAGPGERQAEFGGARPPARMRQLLEELQQQRSKL
jgi:hypothetical protein